ncbi:MAG: hypothetical protein ACLU6Z_05320 [Odoribacter splanchnicus]
MMEEDVAEMEEVVVNGYFTKNKDSFTGNAVVVSKDELAKSLPITCSVLYRCLIPLSV